jgi:pimeloyl-ACP methyl ester carboxylesterase
MIHKISEQAVRLGKQHSLVGIMTRAVTGAPSRNPTVVILNTGIVHRVGHHRMFVTLARALAGQGFNVLRFDFAGIGDSEPRTDSVSPLDSSLADLDEVLDWLERERGISRVIMVGLCSGADHAILYGHSDPRVVALVLMDPSIPATARFYAQYILRRLISLRSYVSVALGRSGLLRLWTSQLFHGLGSTVNMRPASLEDLRFHNYLKQSYRNAIDNDVRILAVFTGETTRQTYREQMLDAFPDIAFGDRLKLEFFPGTDHVFTSEKHRKRLFDLILTWMISMNAQPEAQAAPAPEIEPCRKFPGPADSP